MYWQVIKGTLDNHTVISDHSHELVALVKRDNMNRDYQTTAYKVVRHDPDKGLHEIVRE